MKTLILVFSILILNAVNSFSQIKSVDKESLADLMAGIYTSTDQALKDPSYADITVRMKRIWNERTDGPWLFFELSQTGKEPMKRKVFKIDNTYEGRFKISEYLIKDGWKMQESFEEIFLSDLTPESLLEEEGCHTIVTLMDKDVYEGGNDKMSCGQDNNGAQYIMTDVIINSDGIKKWDKGFDENKMQIWGPVSEAYFFKREK